jgi:hypothetical protein
MTIKSVPECATAGARLLSLPLALLLYLREQLMHSHE